MNDLLIKIGMRLACKSIEISDKDYYLQVSLSPVSGKFVIIASIHINGIDNSSHWFSSSLYSDVQLLAEYRKLLRLLNKRVIR